MCRLATGEQLHVPGTQSTTSTISHLNTTCDACVCFCMLAPLETIYNRISVCQVVPGDEERNRGAGVCARLI